MAGVVRTVFAGGDLGELAGEGRRMVEKRKIFLQKNVEQVKGLSPSANHMSSSFFQQPIRSLKMKHSLAEGGIPDCVVLNLLETTQTFRNIQNNLTKSNTR